jgi:hypothetical protein
MLSFRKLAGPGELLTIESSEPRHVEFTLRARSDSMVAYGTLDVSDGDSPRVSGPSLAALGRNVPVASLRIDAAVRTRAVNGTAALLDSFYVFPAIAKRMSDSVRARLTRGAYDSYGSGPGFAMRLNRDLGEIAHDRHLRIGYSVRVRPPQNAQAATPITTTAERLSEERREMDKVNCGFQRADVLDGNVGYVKFDMFADPEVCGATAQAAMSFVAGTRALIIDLRENHGGRARMVAFIASYLFDHRTHLNDLWTRSTDSTQEFWTSDSVPGRRFGSEKSIYVLTAARTFSGGEELAYDLKALKRATIVGETTGGGAHPVSDHRIDDHFTIGVPWGKAINPVTHTNWEGVGVEPDVKVSALEALATAQRLLQQSALP